MSNDIIDEKIINLRDVFDFHKWKEEELKEISNKLDDLLRYMMVKKGWEKE